MTFHVARIAVEMSVTVRNFHATMQVMRMRAADSLTKSKSPSLSAVAAQVAVSSKSSDLIPVKAENESSRRYHHPTVARSRVRRPAASQLLSLWPLPS